MPNANRLTETIDGVEFNRDELFEMKNMMASPGCGLFERLVKAWEDERLAELLVRALPPGLVLSDHLTLVSGKMEMLGILQTLPGNVDRAYKNIVEREESGETPEDGE